MTYRYTQPSISHGYSLPQTTPGCAKAQANLSTVPLGSCMRQRDEFELTDVVRVFLYGYVNHAVIVVP